MKQIKRELPERPVVEGCNWTFLSTKLDIFHHFGRLANAQYLGHSRVQ